MHQPDWSTPGKRLRFARVARGMSQVQLSLATGFPQTQISKWELDKVRPTKRTAQAISVILMVPWYWIRDGLKDEPARMSARARYLHGGNEARELTGKEAETAQDEYMRRRNRGNRQLSGKLSA